VRKEEKQFTRHGLSYTRQETILKAEGIKKSPEIRSVSILCPHWRIIEPLQRGIAITLRTQNFDTTGGKVSKENFSERRKIRFWVSH
jgi:hypothetical protein